MKSQNKCVLSYHVKPIEPEWVFHTKPDGTKTTRLVAKGFQADRSEQVYAHVAKLTTIRLALSHSLQMDVRTAFLNATRDTDVYIFQSKGCFIGTELTIAEDRIELSQHKLIDKMLKRFNLQECKRSPSPMEDRPDTGTSDKKLVYQKCLDECSRPITFTVADWGSDKTDRKSVSEMASSHCGNLVLWSSKRELIVVLISAEAEYTSCCVAASDLLYLKGLLSEFVGETGGLKCCLTVDSH
ncbi:hypothetical protein PR048_004400 [Dryococelus australis]|uniref:Reverse transcriptase Ty1/copia-type domain-containing protein n=1 Tax=Dryococelus australis TaxID=614101 RepID=A0ABQ9I661_9NEOP|nr:hypothetical protein PR048_004400 [Dryococelus australis]